MIRSTRCPARSASLAVPTPSWCLREHRAEQRSTAGRDIEEAEHAATFDPETCRWTVVGDAADVHRSEERQRVAAALADGEMTIADLVAATGMARRNLDKLLHFMVKDGEAVRIKRGVYGPMVHPR